MLVSILLGEVLVLSVCPAIHEIFRIQLEKLQVSGSLEIHENSPKNTPKWFKSQPPSNRLFFFLQNVVLFFSKTNNQTPFKLRLFSKLIDFSRFERISFFSIQIKEDKSSIHFLFVQLWMNWQLKRSMEIKDYLKWRLGVVRKFVEKHFSRISSKVRDGKL